MGGWRKLYYVQLHGLCTLPNTGWSKCHLTLHVWHVACSVKWLCATHFY